MKPVFSQRLLRWFDRHGRKHLPWQNPITPYRVWVSEIMLQQTQVDTVIPYFERFMEHFPEVEALASAPLDQVLHLWTGLGYYARARNLYLCAQIIVREYRGIFPDDVGRLTELPGVGPSTAAAIASIAFEQPAAILDGNVKRVLARHSAVAGWPGQPKVAAHLWSIAERHMPAKRCRDYTQAIMDLGATLCTRSRPKCDQCPVAEDCIARHQGNPTAYPGKKPAREKPVKSAYLLIVQAPDGDILLEQRPPQGIWGGLWCLPEVPVDQPLELHVSTHYGAVRHLELWTGWRHTFTHYHFDIQPVAVELVRRPAAVVEEGRRIWYNLRRPPSVGLAAPVKALLLRLQQERLQANLF